jgi:hypothetical protein
MTPDVRPVLIKKCQEVLQRSLVHLRSAPKQGEGSEHVHRPQSDLHRTIPVDAAGRRILFAPARKLLPERLAQLMVAGDCIGTAQGYEVT